MKELRILSYDEVTKALAASDKFVNDIELDGNQEKFVRRVNWKMLVIDKTNNRIWEWGSWQNSMLTSLTWFRTVVHNNNKRRHRYEYISYAYGRYQTRIAYSSNELMQPHIQALIGNRLAHNLLIQREEFFTNVMGYNKTSEYTRIIVTNAKTNQRKVHHIPFKKLFFGYYQIYNKNRFQLTFMTHMSGWTGM